MSRVTDPERPVPSRSQLILSTRDWSPLEDVARAVSVATEYETKLYVERLDAKYRWSLIHRGGPYPLLRITDRFLQVDYHSIFIGCKEIEDGYSSLSENHLDVVPSASAILTFDGPTPTKEVQRLIQEALE